MQAIKCKYCGGSIALSSANHGYCTYCGQEVTFPSSRDERVLSMYERANHFRAQGEFDRAYSAYQHLVEENNTDAELHWNLLLCRYGVEYVEDKRVSSEELNIREYKPTISRMSFEPILEDPDYKAAIQYADETSRRIYRTEAGKLARIQTQYQQIARSEEPYDVFISFKAEENKVRTKASEMAQEIYEQLTAKGLKVFFSRITLENKLSEVYEPYIFAALKSARVMLLVADKKEQINARWVKNEWSRFRAMQEEDRSKYIIPVFNSELQDSIGPYDFPDSTAQAQDMGKVGAMQDLVRGVLRMTGRAESEQIYVMEGGVTVENLLRRASHALKDGAFDEVIQLTNDVLDVDAENGQAYLYQLLAENNASTMRDLMVISLDWKNNKDYARALRYGGDREKAEIALFEEECKKERIYRKAKAYAEKEEYTFALNELKDIGDYQDVSELAALYRKEKEKQDLIAEYHKEIGDPLRYLNKKFRETYPAEAAKWEKLKAKAERSRRADGSFFPWVVKLAWLGVAIYIVLNYEMNKRGMTNADGMMFVWALVGGLSIWIANKRKRWFVKLVLPVILLFLGAEIADMCYLEHWISFELVPLMVVIISGVPAVTRARKAINALSAKSDERRKNKYYVNTVGPIGAKLRREVYESWEYRIGRENMVRLGDID